MNFSHGISFLRHSKLNFFFYVNNCDFSIQTLLTPECIVQQFDEIYKQAFLFQMYSMLCMTFTQRKTISTNFWWKCTWKSGSNCEQKLKTHKQRALRLYIHKIESIHLKKKLNLLGFFCRQSLMILAWRCSEFSIANAHEGTLK